MTVLVKLFGITLTTNNEFQFIIHERSSFSE